LVVLQLGQPQPVPQQHLVGLSFWFLPLQQELISFFDSTTFLDAPDVCAFISIAF
jgi:hypothetical protein